MKVYSPSEIADLMKIKTATLRKYSILLENAGYSFNKNSRKQRYYSDNDIIVLRKLITFKDNGMTLDESVEGVILWHSGNESKESDITLSESETDNVTDSNNNEMEELKELINKQTEMIGELSKRLDRQQEYIDNRMKERDNLLMERLNESLAAKKEIASGQEVEEKKGFFNKLFNKNN